MRVDEEGDLWIAAIVAGAAVGGITSFVSSIATDIFTGGLENIDLTGAFISAGIGAVSGGLMVACPGAGALISSASSALESVIGDLRSDKKKTTREMIINATVSAGLGAVTGMWENGFANNSLYDDAVSSVVNVFKVGNKTAKRVAKKTLKKASKHFGKELLSSQCQGLAISGGGETVSFLINGTISSWG